MVKKIGYVPFKKAEQIKEIRRRLGNLGNYNYLTHDRPDRFSNWVDIMKDRKGIADEERELTVICL